MTARTTGTTKRMTGKDNNNGKDDSSEDNGDNSKNDQ